MLKLPPWICLTTLETGTPWQRTALHASIRWFAKEVPIVSIVVPFFGLTNFCIIKDPKKGNPRTELQWRLEVTCSLGCSCRSLGFLMLPLQMGLSEN